MAGDCATFSVAASAPAMFLCLSVAVVVAAVVVVMVAAVVCLLAVEWMCDAVISLMIGGI